MHFRICFKANTNDTRESAAINICKDLLEEGAVLFIHDPKVEKIQIAKDLCKNENEIINLSRLAKENNLDVLIEVHTLEELKKSLN